MYKLFTWIPCLIFTITCTMFGQKKMMTPEVYNQWQKIESTTVSNNGQYVGYVLTTEVGDKRLYLYHTETKQSIVFNRSSSPTFDHQTSKLIFRIHPPYDTVKALKLKGTKTDELPPDTLAIYDLRKGITNKIPDIQSFQVAENWDNYVFTMLKPSMEKLQKKENKENGTKLLRIHLANMIIDTLPYVTEYVISKESPGLLYASSGNDSLLLPGIYRYDFENLSDFLILGQKGKYFQLSLSDDGKKGAFIIDTDTTKVHVRPYTLYQFSEDNIPSIVAEPGSSFIPEGYQVSHHKKSTFSGNGDVMYFGISPIPLAPDTTKTKEEMPVVEVWSTDDHMLYTQQKVRKSSDEKRSIAFAKWEDSGKILQLESETITSVYIPKNTPLSHYYGTDNTEYIPSVIWEGSTPTDLYLININSGNYESIGKRINGSIAFSPSGKFAYWFDRDEQTYFIFDPELKSIRNLTFDIPFKLGEEDNDRPQPSYPYGIVGFTEDEQYVFVNDHYDIWKVNLQGNEKSVNVTQGRKNKWVYRYIKTNPDEEYLDLDSDWIFHVFDEKDKSSGYALRRKNGSITELANGAYYFSMRIWKAKDHNLMVFTRENFREFPDLYMSKDLKTGQYVQMSQANPQQSEYIWGDGKIYTWKGFDGSEMTGMLFTPDGFDKGKTYPLIVNFYEKSSDGLHNHRPPFAGRSTISYSYYLSKGYVIFNPDVPYEIGYPGRSAFNAVMSGLESLLNEGFIDTKRIGIHGHSWGGYQIADILTKTDLFACAESGAPVVNMISAYGGIRWASGMSRMFQYEKGQSRLGATLWERPDLYIENSPLFNMDKVTTPVLILHNDEDGAVPWYQGIEYFVALRRLGKKAWLLNYNGEPHWPVKWPNRLDFQIRMEQFFDYYLMGRPMPLWMKKGIPEINKGLELGY